MGRGCCAAKSFMLLCLSGIVACGAELAAWSLGDLAYRRADFEAAESFYRSAQAADPSCARALWGLGRIEELHFRSGAARDYFAAAFRLDPHDPEIAKSHASVARQNGELTSPYQSYSLPMKPYFPASARAAGMTLSVSVNGAKPLRLIFDTGANGILIRSKAAQKLDLEWLGVSRVGGLGGGAAAAARVALAESVQIGELRLRDCPVEVTDSIPASDADGVIGARVFQDFVIRFDAHSRLLDLMPFPGSGMERFTHALQVGHLLLVRARANAERFGYFVLDTGAAFSALPADLARSRGPGATPLYGASGRIHDTMRITPVQFHLGGEPLIDQDATAFDLQDLSRRQGVEISGLIGYPALSQAILTINYRDGLVDIQRR